MFGTVWWPAFARTTALASPDRKSITANAASLSFARALHRITSAVTNGAACLGLALYEERGRERDGLRRLGGRDRELAVVVHVAAAEAVLPLRVRVEIG